MKKQLFKTLKKSASSSTSYSSSESGFSLVELAVIVVMIGIFSAIAAPVWDVFVSRQRVGAVNNQVLQALQSAQAEAKRTKEEITVTFDESVDPPKYQIGNQPQEDLNINGEVPVGKIKIYVQANGDAAVNAITFNYMGAVEYPKPVSSGPPPENTDGFTVTVSTPDDGLRQCVKVVTILGAMITSEGDDNPTGCP
jgi:type II secretory pathway pseudopilin PulG